ncbi:MAG: NfeD family protein [Candidatus Hydrothermia bacterium]
MFLAILKVPIWLQLLSYAIFSLVFTILSRKFFKSLVKTPEKVTGPERLIEKTVLIIAPLKERPNYYIVKAEDDEWLAYSTKPLKEGDLAQVKGVRGNYLVIE